MCPTVWIGRSSSVVVAPVACRARLHMSHRLDLPFLNLLVKAFAGKLLVMICISRCLSQIGMFRPIRMDHTNCLQVAIKTIQFNSAFVFRSFARGF